MHPPGNPDEIAHDDALSGIGDHTSRKPPKHLLLVRDKHPRSVLDAQPTVNWPRDTLTLRQPSPLFDEAWLTGRRDHKMNRRQSTLPIAEGLWPERQPMVVMRSRSQTPE